MNIIADIKKLYRRSGFTVVLNVIGMSIAFAAFFIIMIQVDYDGNFDSCHRDSERIYRLDLSLQDKKMAVVSRPIANYITQSPKIEASTLMNPQDYNVSCRLIDGDVLFNENFRMATPSFSDVFHLEMIEGDAGALAKPDNVLLSQSIAQKFFGAEQALGKQFESQGKILIVGGVYKDFPANSSMRNVIYMPLPEDYSSGWTQMGCNAYVKTSVSAGDIEGERISLEAGLAKILREKESQMPRIRLCMTPLRQLHYTSDTFYDTTPKASRQTVFILMTIAAAIVLIAGVNYMNFNLALAPSRIRSVNTHKVFGATNALIRIRYVVESVLVGICALIIAFGIVFVVSRSSIASLVDTSVSLSANPAISAMTFTVAVVVGVLAGLYPSYYVTSFPPALVLKGSFGLSVKAIALRRTLIGMQFFTTFVLVMASWFMYLQNKYLSHVNMGYDREHVIVADAFNISGNRETFSDKLKSFPGIESVTYASSILSASDDYNTRVAEVDGKEIMFQWIQVDPTFLDVMGIKETDGDGFATEDAQSKGKYIFNEKARNEFGLTLNSDIDGIQIAGFISDIQHTTFRTLSPPMAFLVSSGAGNGFQSLGYAYIRTNPGCDLQAVMGYIRSTLDELNTTSRQLSVQLYDEIFDNVYRKEQRLATLVSLFSIIAVFISIIGVLGLVFFENRYRRHEIGIRKVLGSTEVEVLALFNRSYLVISCTSFAVACPVAYFFMSEWLRNFSSHIYLHWWVFVISGIFVVLVTIITVSWKSWKTAISNPLDILRN